ncbi:FlgD-like protein [Kribbella amoyensis]|uniref:FlgD-like protein n=1 Tax=Kribbella amoyensis TaxID=996641 RepID=A0A561BTI0_9ACTN|nr:FlgD immunoglobulin-like domain containing protein [Kribbella amoyensis]TWD82200.1 FlgD-like protein [Kribbella amoyensis]
MPLTALPPTTSPPAPNPPNLARRCRLLLALALVLVLASAPTQAQAAGVVELDRFAVVEPYVTVLGASPSGVLYRVSRLHEQRLVEDSAWVKPADGPAYQVDLSFKRLAGDKIFGAQPFGTATYQYIGSQQTHTCSGVPQPVHQFGMVDGVALFASFGWLGENGERVEVSPTGCRVTARYPAIGAEKLIAMDDRGYLTVDPYGGVNGERPLAYRAYAAPTSPRVVADGGYNRRLDGVALSGTAVSWRQFDYDQQPTTHSYVVRSSVDGSKAPQVTRVEGSVIDTAIAGGTTSWIGGLDGVTKSGSVRADGTRTAITGTTRSVVSDGTKFVYDTSGPTQGAPAGVDVAATLGGSEPVTRIASVGKLTPLAEQVSVGAGGVAYVDWQPPAESVNRRLYTQSGSTITLGEQTRLGHGGSYYRQVSREGRRTAYADDAGGLWLVGDDGVRTKVFTSTTRVAILGGNELRLSGSRLLWWKAKYTRDHCEPPNGPPNCDPVYGTVVPMLYDLRTGVSTELALPATKYRAVDLWGNFLTWADAQNAIWRRDLHSGAVRQAKAAGTASVRSVAVHDDWVAWATCQASGGDQCAQSVLGHRNLQTQAPAIQLTSAHTEVVRLSGGHVVYSTYPQAGHVPSTGTVKVWRLGTSATGVVGSVWWRTKFDVHDETLGWVGPDGIARIGPNSPFVAYPKYLGNGHAPASFTPATRTWNPEFGISKALPTCSLTISAGTTVRRVLPCATTTGSARASWDGRDSAGTLLPKGTYTWTLAGRDGDGTLRWWTGATHPITGTVRID